MNVAPKVESTDLAVVQKLTPAIVFAPGGVNDILEKIAREVRSTQTDISTKAGREAVASLAYKVARSKTALDKMGKELGETHYKSWKAITSERARIETELDALRDEVRKPLTDWENAEKDRINDHEQAVLAIEGLTRWFGDTPTAADIKTRLADFEALPPRQWEEFSKRAETATAAATSTLMRMYEEARTREAEAAELIRLRAEQIAREQKERDDKIAAEAAERARVEAETKAAAEAAAAEERAKAVLRKAEEERHAAMLDSVRAENERREAQLRADAAEAARVEQAAQAERDAKAAAEAAERRQAAALEAERKRVADEAAAFLAETAAREANTKHRSKINNEVLTALEQILPSKDLAKAVVTAIAKGEIPHTRIGY